MIDNQQWLDRWTQNRIAFHEDEVNRHLQAHLSRFSLQPGATVFLPLCGKTHDIAWLAGQGFKVIGIELSELAIEAFFEEQGLRFQSFESDRFILRKAENISLLQGDFFDLRAEDLADTALVYDRAALIAIEESMRAGYCEHLMSVVPSASEMLLITLDYEQAHMQGPPYAVSEAEVRRHYSDRFAIDLLESNDVLDERPRWREQGLQALRELIFLCTG